LVLSRPEVVSDRKDSRVEVVIRVQREEEEEAPTMAQCHYKPGRRLESSVASTLHRAPALLLDAVQSGVLEDHR
jgi:hypothetical protein